MGHDRQPRHDLRLLPARPARTTTCASRPAPATCPTAVPTSSSRRAPPARSCSSRASTIAEESSEVSIEHVYHAGSSPATTRASPTSPVALRLLRRAAGRSPGLDSPIGLERHVHVDPHADGLGDDRPGAPRQRSVRNRAQGMLGIDGPVHRPLRDRRRRTSRRNSRRTSSPRRRKDRTAPDQRQRDPRRQRLQRRAAMSRDFSHFVFSSSNYSKASSATDVTRRSSSLRAARPAASAPPTTTTSRTREVERHLEAARAANRSRRSEPDRRRKGDRLPRGLPGRLPHPDGNAGEPDRRANCAYLYMRVNDAITYDISEGEPVIPIGMTRSGEKVFFTTDEQLVPGRHRLQRRPLHVARGRHRRRRTDRALPGQRPGQRRRMHRLLGPERLRRRIPPARTAPSGSRHST